MNGQALSGGDGVTVQQEALLRILARTDVELLLFNLP
jgi:hypothetical protein